MDDFGWPPRSEAMARALEAADDLPVRVYVMDRDGTIRVWETPAGEPVIPLESLKSLPALRISGDL